MLPARWPAMQSLQRTQSAALTSLYILHHEIYENSTLTAVLKLGVKVSGRNGSGCGCRNTAEKGEVCSRGIILPCQESSILHGFVLQLQSGNLDSHVSLSYRWLGGTKNGLWSVTTFLQVAGHVWSQFPAFSCVRTYSLGFSFKWTAWKCLTMEKGKEKKHFSLWLWRCFKLSFGLLDCPWSYFFVVNWSV